MSAEYPLTRQSSTTDRPLFFIVSTLKKFIQLCEKNDQRQFDEHGHCVWDTQLEDKKLLKIRRTSIAQAVKGNLAPLAKDVKSSLHVYHTKKEKIIDEVYALWKHVPDVQSVLDERTIRNFSARRNIEKAFQSTAFSQEFKALYRMSGISIDCLPFRHGRHYSGRYDGRFKTAEFTDGQKDDEGQTILYHEVGGHGLEYEFGYGLNTLTHPRTINSSERNSKIDQLRWVVCERLEVNYRTKTRNMSEGFAEAVELLCHSKKTGVKSASTAYSDTRFESELRENPAEALVQFNYDYCNSWENNTDENDKRKPTPPELAVNLAIRYGKLLHTLFPEEVAPVPPNIRKQLLSLADERQEVFDQYPPKI